MRASLLAFIAILHALPAFGDVPRLAPEGPPWDTSPGFDFSREVRRSLSGIACPSDAGWPRLCVAVFDEGGEASYVEIDRDHLKPLPTHIPLLTSGGEPDTEAAANDGGFVYVASSYARSRRDCAANLDNRSVYRLKVEPDGNVLSSPRPVDDQGRLWQLMSADPELGRYVDKCLGARGHGINIEGLAARDDRLYFGFREPATDHKAYVLRVAARALFEGGDMAPRLFTIEAGSASGIRDLLAVRDGLLVLVGPDDDSKAVPWWIGFWDGNDATGDMKLRRLAELRLPAAQGGDCQKEIKPEAMTLLEDGPDFRRLLILSDGMCDGGPMTFRVPK